MVRCSRVPLPGFHMWNNLYSAGRLLLHVADERRKYQVDNQAGSSRRRAVGD